MSSHDKSTLNPTLTNQNTDVYSLFDVDIEKVVTNDKNLM